MTELKVAKPEIFSDIRSPDEKSVMVSWPPLA
jgi:hypothetical protein